MAAEDWDDHDSYKPEEGENIYDATCKYCGRSGLRWTIGHWHRWELHDWLGTRHWCAEYTAARNAPASADEFPSVPNEKRFVWKGHTLSWNSGPAQLQNLPRITGKSADLMILDDPQEEHPAEYRKYLERWYTDSGLTYNGEPIFWDKIGDSNMPTTKPTKTKKARKPKAPNYFTIGVRFLKSPSTIYTYKVRKGAKVFLGQELIAPPNQHGIDVVVAVRIDKLPQDTDPSITYKFIERKVSPL